MRDYAKIVSIGAKIRSTVVRKTGFLIVAKQDISLVDKRGEIAEEVKVGESIEQGYEIEIINERKVFYCNKWLQIKLTETIVRTVSASSHYVCN
ncbi:hypothetical protein ACFFIS_06770 [Virgibacillus soli]|uniref:Uncharacterized protein n=1 Tax=Paracerasibacillus soli TaxID=480284 RepID=A0ABU5CMR0_9BACI|nr:hypothetical protein [Virgibacillus soli]MDY0407653.1 hypothetical protein [Virgibacillus soli]